MTSVTISVSEEFKDQLKQFSWVNWSEIAREEVMKKLIFEHYIKSGNISGEDCKFCEKIDWHPVDELPLKKSFLKKINKIRKGKFLKYNSLDELLPIH